MESPKAPKCHRSATASRRWHIRSRHQDTLVFGVASNKVYKQVYDLTKVDESNKAPMMTISEGDEKSDLHTVHREFAYSTKKKHQDRMPDINSIRWPKPKGFNRKKISLTSVQVKRMLQEWEHSRKISKLLCQKFQKKALWQDQPLQKGVYAAMPSKGSRDCE